MYGQMTNGKAGLLGTVLGRADPNTSRLALLYALLDGAACIRLPHLKAALAIWRYSEETAKRIFGTARRNKTEDTVLAFLEQVGPDGATRQISRLFGSHKPSTEIESALGELQKDIVCAGKKSPPLAPQSGGGFYVRNERTKRTKLSFLRLIRKIRNHFDEELVMNIYPLQIEKRPLRSRRATEVYALTCYGCHRTVALSTHAQYGSPSAIPRSKCNGLRAGQPRRKCS